jgi:hypothetical protein|tara:strand:+ start:48 stop:203 length:156 start_codon:yes stop_codon:yes gene_type:complete
MDKDREYKNINSMKLQWIFSIKQKGHKKAYLSKFDLLNPYNYKEFVGRKGY